MTLDGSAMPPHQPITLTGLLCLLVALCVVIATVVLVPRDKEPHIALLKDLTLISSVLALVAGIAISAVGQ
jgi:hypothetical protein